MHDTETDRARRLSTPRLKEAQGMDQFDDISVSWRVKSPSKPNNNFGKAKQKCW